MVVWKFGGTSVGKPERMKKIAKLVTESPGKKIVVLSALSGTTNTLVKMGDYLLAKNQTGANGEMVALEKHYTTFINHHLLMKLIAGFGTILFIIMIYRTVMKNIRA